jgi:ureidoglycolate lyase
MVERHPLGSQAFIPMSPRPFIVVVCPDDDNCPGTPRAFITKPGQGVNYPRNLWHGILTPIGEPQDFVVVDRGGDGTNLEEFFFQESYEVHLPIHYRADPAIESDGSNASADAADGRVHRRRDDAAGRGPQ